MKFAALGSISDIRTGKLDVNAGSENGQYPFFTCAAKPYQINDFAFDSEAVLIAGNGDLNVKYYQGKFNAYQRTYVIQNKDSSVLSMKYLYYFIETYMERLRRGAIGGIIKYIKLRHLTEAEIPLPPLNDQIRIAQLLGKMEGLIAQHKQHLQQLDDLLKSVFLEMFGDPVRNEKGWDKKPFNDLLDEIDSGKSPKCEARPATAEEWGVLKLGSVSRCVFEPNENKALPLDVAPSTKHEIKPGDLLFSRKNTYELVAACAYVFETRPKLLMPDLIFRFVFKEGADINPIYIWKLLTNHSQRKAIQSFAAGAAGSMPNISKTNIRTARLPIPPPELQDRFAAIVEQVEALKSRYQQSLVDLESLYGVLSQQAFKGELDLSRVPLPDDQPNSETAAPEPDNAVPEESQTVSLPNTKYLLEALTDNTQRQRLFAEWLDNYCQQRGVGNFSANEFMNTAQSHLGEFQPDAEFELGVEDYDYVKNWVLSKLKAGSWEQRFDERGNRVQLAAQQQNTAANAGKPA